MESPFETPSILIEPPDDQDYPSSLYPRNFDDDEFLLYNYSNNSTESTVSNHAPFSLYLDTSLSNYRSQPSSPHSPLSEGFPDDVSELFNLDCPSPGAMSDSSYTPNSPYLSTPLSDSLSNFHFQDLPHSPQLRGFSDVGPGPTIAPGDVFGLHGGSGSYNGSYEHIKPPCAITTSTGFEPEVYIGSPTEQDSLSPHAPPFINPRLVGHRTMLSEPNFPTNSLLMQGSGADTQQPPSSPIRTERQHHRSHSDSNDLLSPEAAQGPHFTRGRREHRGGSSRSPSRRSSPYALPNTSQESLYSAVGGSVEPLLGFNLHRRRSPNPDSASYPGTPIIGNDSEASSSSQNLVSPSTSVMVMSSSSYEFSDMSSVSLAPRKVGSEKLDEASNKRRKNEAKHLCPVCGRALTTKHNVKNHMKSHYNIKDWICEDCDKGFTTGHVLKRHWKVCKKRKSRLGESEEHKDLQDVEQPDES